MHRCSSSSSTGTWCKSCVRPTLTSDSNITNSPLFSLVCFYHLFSLFCSICYVYFIMFVSYFMSLTNNRKCVEVGRGSEEVLHLACEGEEIRSPHLQLKGGTTSHVMTACMPGTNIFFFFNYLFLFFAFFSFFFFSPFSPGWGECWNTTKDGYTRH